MSTERKLALDLTRYHTRRVLGDITLFTTWMLLGNQPIACLVLIPSRGRSDTYRPAIVLSPNAWVWSDIGDPGECVRLSLWFASGLGFNPNDHNTVMRITTIIRDHIGDLLFVPPMPSERREVADVLVTDHSTGKTRESVVTDRV